MKKFEAVYSIEDYEVLADTGFVSAKNIMLTKPFYVYELILENGQFIRCADDHIVFMSDYEERFVGDLFVGDQVITNNGLLTVVDIAFHDIQEKMYDIEIDTDDHRYYTNGVLSHNTTTAAAFILYEAIFKENTQSAILANKGDTARDILDRVKKMFENLPVFLKPGVEVWNKGSVEFSNGCKILSAASGSSSIRGRSLNTVYLDEFAFLQNDSEFFASTYPVISSGEKTKMIITSTPRGMNLFYKLWSNAVEGKNNFYPTRVTWDEHPKRDAAWAQNMVRDIGQRKFDVEFGCKFLGSTDTLISPDTLEVLVFKDPLKDEDNLKIYEYPNKTHTYVACIDTAEGIGKDYSVINIIDVTEKPFKQVAVYRNNLMPPLLFTDNAYRIMRYYNEAFCIIETDSSGQMVASALFNDLEYENMLFTKEKDSQTISSTTSTRIGLKQSRKTKLIGCSTLKTLIESRTLELADYNTIFELSVFIKKGNSFEAEKGKNDDTVMTLVLFAWLTEQPVFEELADDNIRHILRQNMIEQGETTHSVFGFFDDGTDDSFSTFD